MRVALFTALTSLLAVASIASDASAQAVVAASRFYMVVERGHRVGVDHFISMDPDCRSRGPTSVQLLSAPQGGQVASQYASRFPNFVRANVRSRCDTRRSPSTVIFYTARPDFTGVDTFDVEVFFPDGIARKVRYRVDVR